MNNDSGIANVTYIHGDHDDMIVIENGDNVFAIDVSQHIEPGSVASAIRQALTDAWDAGFAAGQEA